MKIARHKNANSSLFVKMLITFIVLTIVMSTAIGISSLMIYENFYIKTVNENVRQDISNNHQNLVMQINSIRDDIIGNIFMQQYGFLPQILDQDLDSENYMYLKEIYDYLNQLVLRNGQYVNGVHIYYKDNNMLISSKYGLKLLDSHNGEGIELDWLELMFVSDIHNDWIHTREIAFTTASNSLKESNYSYVTTYPMLQSSKEARIMICIDFDEKMLNERLNIDEASINYILDSKGNVISAPVGFEVQAFSEDKFTQGEGYFSETINDKNYLIFYRKDSSNNWLLVNQHPTGGLYETMDQIKLAILAIYLFITALGVIASFMIASRFYNPLRDLMITINHYDENEDVYNGGEYNHINSVIKGLGGHVSQLQETIDSSRGLLLAKFIGDLSRKSALSKEEIADRMNFLDITMNKSEFFFMQLDISFLDASELKPSQAQIIKYRLINEIRELSDENTALLATDYEDHSILVLINTDFSIEAFKRSKLNDLTKIESVFSAEVFIQFYIMDSVSDIQKMYQSYRQLEKLKQMSFYRPTQKVITTLDLPNEESKDVFNRDILKKFENVLYSGGDEIYEEVTLVLKEVLKPKYTIGEKQETLMNLIGIVAKYIKDISLKSQDIMDDNIYDLFKEMEDINMFRMWLIEIIRKVQNRLNDTNNSSHNDTILKVKSYIDKHMEEDLSLSQVAGKVFLSPQYLSALFKKEVGLNFSTYLQGLRMEKAKLLLLETEMKVEEVGIKVGYRTSHYFIKKFKEHTGLTPRQFRNRNTKI